MKLTEKQQLVAVVVGAAVLIVAELSFAWLHFSQRGEIQTELQALEVRQATAENKLAHCPRRSTHVGLLLPGAPAAADSALVNQCTSFATNRAPCRRTTSAALVPGSNGLAGRSDSESDSVPISPRTC